jgi:hypothetical protein
MRTTVQHFRFHADAGPLSVELTHDAGERASFTSPGEPPCTEVTSVRDGDGRELDDAALCALLGDGWHDALLDAAVAS